MGGEQVGEHLGVEAGGDRLVTHLFECLDPAYPGWRWAVTVTRAARAKTVTVDDSALLPGPDALLAPAWVPWRDRLQPGDVGVGDLLPAHEDDERLVPMVMLAGDDAVVDWYADGPAGGARSARGPGGPEPAFPGRVRVLSPAGRDETAERWYDSEHGPRTPLARAAPATCASCGFFVPLSGVLGQVFGGCANAYAPDDGRIVSGDHGCGAHSEYGTRRDPGRPSRRWSTSSATTWWTCLGSRWTRPCSSRSPASPEPLSSVGPSARAGAARSAGASARRRCRCGTYHSPKRPEHRPVTQVQTHQRSPAGRLLRTNSTTSRAIAQPAVMTAVISRSLPSSGGGGVRRVAATRSGYLADHDQRCGGPAAWCTWSVTSPLLSGQLVLSSCGNSGGPHIVSKSNDSG